MDTKLPSDAQKRFHEAFLLHGPYLRTQIRRWGVPDHEVEDFLQNVFETGLRRQDALYDSVPPRSWLRRIALFRLLNWRKQRRGRRASQHSAPWHLEQVNTSGVRFSESCERRVEGDDWLQHCLARVEFKSRRVFVLNTIYGFSRSEISELLNLPSGTVGGQIHRAKQGLRDSLARLERGRPRPQASS